MNTPKKRLVLIDGNAIIHRAYHAIPPLSNREGMQTNAVYGFTSMLLKVLSDLKPDFLVATFDMAGGTFRDEVYEHYKATRVKADQELYDQIPLVHELVEGFGIPIFEREGYEADDVIGTIAQQVCEREKDIEVVIVSGDKDLLQLVNDCVHVYLLKKGLSELEMYAPEQVVERFGFSPKQMIDYKAIAGDSSDNIPGVKGIGDKGAKELIAKVGGVEEIYAQIDELEAKEIKPAMIKKLKESEKAAKMSLELATIHCEVPDVDFDVDAARFEMLDHDAILPLFQKFGFVSLLKRLPVETGARGSETQKKTQKNRKKSEVIQVDQKNFESACEKWFAADVLGIKEVLVSKDIFDLTGVGFVLSVGEKIYYVSLSALEEKQRARFFEIFKQKKKTLVGHDIKQVVKVLSLLGVSVSSTLFDIMIASYILDSSTRAHEMPSIVLRELGEELAQIPKENLFGVDPAAYAEEVDCFLPLYESYQKKLDEQQATKLFQEIEMDLILVLAHMEISGILLDTEVLTTLSKEANKRLESVTREIWKEAGEEFNVASSTQLRDILFEKMELPTDGIKKGKTGYSTAASELEKLRGQSPIIEMIEEHRELSKLLNTYIDVLPRMVNAHTGRIHTTFAQAVAATGRLSSTDPNLQNIPVRTEFGRRIRDAFVAEPGKVLVIADYSQIELRIAAALSKDQTMIDIFKRGEDVHRATAAVINDVPIEAVTKEMRSAAKAVNFGVLFGQGAYGLSAQTDMTQWEAKEFIAKYFEKFSGIKTYLDAVIVEAKETGYAETFFGRRRYIPELQSSNFQLRSAGERMAINMPIQGTEADIVKLGMIRVFETLQEKKWKLGTDVRLLLQVHDELVLEVKEDLSEEVSQMVQRTMEEVVELAVPIVVDVGIGKNWGDGKE